MALLTVFGIQQQINMANWTVSESSVATTQGVTVSSDVVLTITPNSGYVIAASNFKIGGASNTATNEWTGGNVDIGVNKVTFADTGTANTVGNTVTATVNFDSFSMPGSDKFLYIDIDEIAATTSLSRSVCINTFHTLEQDSAAVDKHTVTTTSNTGITQTDNTSQISSTLQSTGAAVLHVNHQGNVAEGVTPPGTLVLTKVFTTNTINGYYYVATPDFIITTPNYGSYYTVTTSSEVYDSNNNLTSVTFKVFYNPPVNVQGLEDISNMCELGHNIVFRHTLNQLVAVQPGTTTEIKTFTGDQNYISSDGEIRNYKATGDSGAQFKLAITSSDSSKTYDFTTNTFTADATDSGTITIPTSGAQNFKITFPPTSSDLNYNFVITPEGTTKAKEIIPTTTGSFKVLEFAPVVVTLGLLDGANVYDDSELLDGSPNTAITIRGQAGQTMLESSTRTFSYTIQPDMITAGSGSIAPKASASLDFSLNVVQEVQTKLDGTSSTTSVDVDSTTGVTAGDSVNWDTITRFVGLVSSGREFSVTGTGSGGLAPIDGEVVKTDHTNLVVGMDVTGEGVPAGTVITAVSASLIRVNQRVELTNRSALSFTTSGITVSSVTDSNTLVLSQTIPLAQDDLDITIGSSTAGSSDTYITNGTCVQSSSNVVIAGTLNVKSFGTSSETVKLDLNELITIS